PVDWHREEERHHDDRLCPRGGTRGTQAAGGSDLPGLPAAVPADHDDDHGGSARRVAVGAGDRYWCGTEAPAGNHDCGRFAAESVVDALYHAGCLFVVRPAGAEIRQVPDRKRNSSGADLGGLIEKGTSAAQAGWEERRVIAAWKRCTTQRCERLRQ